MWTHESSYDRPDTTIEGGTDYDINSLVNNSEHDPDAPVWEGVESATCGDYGGSGSTGAANYKILSEDYADHPAVAFVHGSYSYQGVIWSRSIAEKLAAERDENDEPTPAADKARELIEVIDGLTDYPLISDEAVSEVELEWENTAWESSIADDFRKAWLKRLMAGVTAYNNVPPIVADAMQEMFEALLDGLDTMGGLFTVFEAARDKANIYWESEYNASYIDVDRVVKGAANMLGLDAIQTGYDADASYKLAAKREGTDT